MTRVAIGYEALVQQYGIAPFPHDCESALDDVRRPQSAFFGRPSVTYPRRYKPDAVNALAENLEFAFKNEGLSLAVLDAVFARCDPSELVAYVNSVPAGKYARRAWFLYEWLTGETLDIADTETPNYIDLLDRADYYTTAQPSLSRRQKVRNNLLGTRAFCPIVRRSKTLLEFEAKNLSAKARGIIDEFDDDVLQRATRYLYFKETRSSTEIEREPIHSSRQERFVSALKWLAQVGHLTKDDLVRLQRHIKGETGEDDYRGVQNAVVEALPRGWANVHLVPPKPGDVPELMQGLLDTHNRMLSSDVDPVVHAAVIAFAFVYVHPFKDGNGRMHRSLIHHVLARRGFVASATIFPISAAIQHDMPAYDACLEVVSRPLLEVVDYEYDVDDEMVHVEGETIDHYRFLNLTAAAEYLYAIVGKTIDAEFKDELNFVVRYDRAISALRDRIDMTDQQERLLIRSVVELGRLSRKKRDRHFGGFSDAQVSELEDLVRDAFAS